MTQKYYLSNISPAWPIARQREIIDQKYPGQMNDGNTYSDNLQPRRRRAHKAESLRDRAELCRPTSRPEKGEVVIATLAALAWNTEDLLEVLSGLAERGSTIRILDANLTIKPKSGIAASGKILEAFKHSRKRPGSHLPKGVAGGTKSAERRAATAEEACNAIKDQWKLSKSDAGYEPDYKLLKRAGVSRNTAKKYLGHRGKAQRIYISVKKRKSPRASKGGQ